MGIRPAIRQRISDIENLEAELIEILGINPEIDTAYDDGTIDSSELRLTLEQIGLIREIYGVKDRGGLRRKFPDTFSLARYIHKHREEKFCSIEELERMAYQGRNIFLGIRSAKELDPLFPSEETLSDVY